MAFNRRAQIGLLLAASAIPVVVAATKQCVQLQLPIFVNATNEYYDIPRVENDIDAVQWALDFSVHNQIAGTIIASVPISKTYDISAELCVPTKKTDKSDILQIAVHGNAWDKRYWNVQVRPEQQSYVDAAIAKGYPILTFDRIGTGNSSHANPYNDTQPNTEVEIIAKITTLARSGKLLSAAKIVSSTTAVPTLEPKQIVHVGHSFGSFLVWGLLKTHGNLSDGALLTGFLQSDELNAVKVASFEHGYAATNGFGSYSSGYVVLTTLNTQQKLYFTKKTLDTKLLYYADSIKQPEPVAVYASAAQIFLAEDGLLFKGPVQLIAGELDYVTCDGYCPGTYNETKIKAEWFPSASEAKVWLAPDTAHVINLATSASAIYKKMFVYLAEHGL